MAQDIKFNLKLYRAIIFGLSKSTFDFKNKSQFISSEFVKIIGKAISQITQDK